VYCAFRDDACTISKKMQTKTKIKNATKEEMERLKRIIIKNK